MFGTNTDTDNEKLPPKLARTATAGTAGTELVLRSERQVSYSAYKRAHQAEQVYRAKKQAQQAKKDCNVAKTEFKEAASHFGKGMKCAFEGIRLLPSLIRVRREEVREMKLRKQKEEAIKKRELWEKKAREAEENAPPVPEKEGDEGEEDGEKSEKGKKGKGK